MRFARLTAHAHGPFSGETLHPAPGFTVVWGLNEAGKSSWHSATYLTITGLSRRRGRPPKAEQQIIDRRRPRTGDQWHLEANLDLDDGENLTVNWDLDQKVAKVLDSLGRDRSNQWLTDGAPDLARIVGLDRASFLATACVRQADLQRVRDDAGLLQELLQKATTSADADATASAAIALIDDFRREEVGLDRGNSTKPLMEAKRSVEVTGQLLQDAQAAHRERLDLLADLTDQRNRSARHRREHQVLQTALAVVDARGEHARMAEQREDLDQLVRQVDVLTAQVRRLDHRERVLLAARHHADRADAVRVAEGELAETAAIREAANTASGAHEAARRQLIWAEYEQARRTAHNSRTRLTRATELQDRHPTAPATATGLDTLAHQAHVLTDRWAKRPPIADLTGPTAQDLEQQLAAMANGVPSALASPQEHSPGPPHTTDRSRVSPSTIGTVGGIGLTVLGLVLGMVIHPAMYLLAVAGIAVALLSLWHRSRPGDDAASSELEERLEQAESARQASQHAALTAQLTHRRSQEEQVGAARAILRELDQDLAEMSDSIGTDSGLPAGQQADAIRTWLDGHAEQRRQLQTAHQEWSELTNLVGTGTIEDLAAQTNHHEQVCQERSAEVQQLEPPDHSLQTIEDRSLQDQIHQLRRSTTKAAQQEAELRRQLPNTDPQPALLSAQHETAEALSQLRRIDDEAAGPLADLSVDDLDGQLVRCRQERDQRRQDRDRSAGHLTHLQATLPNQGDTGSDTLDAQILHHEEAFHALSGPDVAGFTLDTLPPDQDLRTRINTVADQEDQVDQLVAGLEGRLQERDAPGANADPATAAENHEADRRELARVQELADVLDETRSLLEAAENRVHRDIAPRLNAATNRWLPRIFEGRYTKVLIDPASLDVQVFAAGKAHRSDLLSQGTTEQFYLLLRVALTETLTAAADETCPLLLDEITVNFDRDRKTAVLEMLREVAAERQVMLFTQEDDVRAWAESNLAGRDKLIELQGRVTT